VAGSCGYDNEPSGSRKSGEFLDKFNILLASQEGLYSMELVSLLSVMTGLKPGEPHSILGRDTGLSLCHNVRTGSGLSPSLLSSGYRGSLLGGTEQLENKADHMPSSNCESKNACS
jgi:hypothetical protein